VRGPEAIHLVQAFEERWNKQADATKLVNLKVQGLLDEGNLENSGGWCCQLSRSIDSRVNVFDRSIEQSFSSTNIDSYDWSDVSDSKAAKRSRKFEYASNAIISYGRCLDQKKGRLVDTSIHNTNIHYIRRAKHSIYIESQYFMGSSFMWSKDSDVKCGNMIAAELTLKICQKIAAREPFTVYILLPMWMEGKPAAEATQGLLHWQRVTIEAMHQEVQKALDARMTNSADYGLEVSDYLNFYCLGTRETEQGSEATGVPETEDEKVLSKTRRHQVYIHSKMMIVDDEVALIGTANINQRSIDGCRDSEIMMTSWQPDHLATNDSIPNGDIHAFRLHVWASITNQMDDAFRNPSSPECVKAFNKIAEQNWQKYIGEETVDMDSHLLPSPFEFEGGKLKARKGLKDGCFTDTKAPALGKQSLIFPEIFLT
jgi:phospholipase D1/2